MIEYIYFVKCPNCEDEHFDFFDEAKAFALGCLSQKPIITQIEVCRNDFGECTDSSDLGTIWSWEDECKECGPDAEKAGSHILTKADLENVPECDPEFDDLDNSVEVEDDVEKEPELGLKLIEELLSSKGLLTESNFGNHMSIDEFIKEFKRLCDKVGLKTIKDIEYFMSETKEYSGTLLDRLEEYAAELEETGVSTVRKPVPEGMTIEQLVEEMEENEDEVECTWCNDLFPKDQCRKEVNLGYLCSRCEAAIKSRGEKLTFIENDYWDFLDEAVAVKDSAAVGSYVRLVHNNSFYHEEGSEFTLFDIKKLLRGMNSVQLNKTQINFIAKFDNYCKVIQETDKGYLVMIPCYYRDRQDRSKLNETPTYVRCWVPKNQTEILDENLDYNPFDHHDPDYDEDEAADYTANQIDRAWDSRYDKALDDYDFFNEDFDDPMSEDEEEVEESIFDDAESVEDVVDILVKDEEEAIATYEEAADKIEELASEETLEETKEILDHIKEEEEEHIEELEELLPEEDETSEISVEEDLAVLGDCPECGAKKAFDHEAGVCNNCGFLI
jgi:hypothetical protein